MRRLEDQRQVHVSTAAAIEKRGRAETMVSQKSGPAFAGPAAPATTALLRFATFHYVLLGISYVNQSATFELFF